MFCWSPAVHDDRLHETSLMSEESVNLVHELNETSHVFRRATEMFHIVNNMHFLG